MQSRYEKLAKRAGRTPESAREEDLVVRWIVVLFVAVFALAAIVVVVVELQGGPGPERDAFPTMLILLPSVIPIGMALRHLHRLKVLQERQRHRDGVVGTGDFIE